ncbi:MAG: DUF2199 domain-containing protein [Aureliella sp.]
MAFRCRACGRITENPNWHFRCELPDRVAESISQLSREEFWGNDDLLQVPGYGSYVRVLIPIRITGLEAMTYRVWLEVLPDELLRAWEVWEQPEYRELKLKGVLANQLKGWPASVLNQDMVVAVKNTAEIPIAIGSSNLTLNSILTNEWDPQKLETCLSC